MGRRLVKAIHIQEARSPDLDLPSEKFANRYALAHFSNDDLSSHYAAEPPDSPGGDADASLSKYDLDFPVIPLHFLHFAHSD